tara:strand:- start:1578 stop:2636 length:1059 start_codon:yes stop_codon:yes gene_type:complete
MKFFNRKEEVLDIQLTQYGKHLVSMGVFKPDQYAFFDDDLIYDREYAGTAEDQNEIAGRIKETPRLRTQYMFQSADKSISDARRTIEEAKLRGETISISLQPDIDKHYALSLPIGSADLGNQYTPSWEVTSYKTPISSSVKYVPLFGVEGTEEKPKLKIPQIHIDINYTITATNEGNYENVVEFEDGTFLAVEKDYLLLELFEGNGLTQNQEFEVEMFKVEDLYTYSVTGAPTLTGQDLTPMKFEKPQTFSKYVVGEDNKLIKNPAFDSEVPGREITFDTRLEDTTDPSMAEYFFNISVDKEISTSVLCKHKKLDTSRGLFTRPLYKCRDETTISSRENIYENLENTEESCD